MKIWTVIFGENAHGCSSFATEKAALKRGCEYAKMIYTNGSQKLPEPIADAFTKLVELDQYETALYLVNHVRTIVRVYSSELTGHVME